MKRQWERETIFFQIFLKKKNLKKKKKKKKDNELKQLWKAGSVSPTQMKRKKYSGSL